MGMGPNENSKATEQERPLLPFPLYFLLGTVVAAVIDWTFCCCWQQWYLFGQKLPPVPPTMALVVVKTGVRDAKGCQQERGEPLNPLLPTMLEQLVN